MPKKILIVQNITREGPGNIADLLAESGIDYVLVDLSREGERIPGSAEEFAAIITLGGPDSANDDTPKIKAQLELARDALKAEVPYLGICLGLQILVKAGGGSVVPALKETGFVGETGRPYTVELTEEGRVDPLFRGLFLEEKLERNGSEFANSAGAAADAGRARSGAPSIPVFQLHGETVELADGMTLLASGELCHNQIVKVGPRAYGIQSHLELTGEMLAVWAEEDLDLAPIGKQQLLDRFKIIEEGFTATGRALLANFIALF